MNARAGQTLHFCYEEEIITALVVKRTSRYLTGKIECGTARGQIREFLQIEILHCQEIFGSSLLQNLLNQVKEATWANGDNSISPQNPPHKPKLRSEYMVPAPIKHKRVWHFMKILGNGADILSSCTNERAKRRLARGNSEKYRKDGRI